LRHVARNDPKNHFNRLVTLDGPMRALAGAAEDPTNGFTDGAQAMPSANA